jgi:hypothetical protein
MIETGAYGERMAGYLHLSGRPDHAKLGVGKSQPGAPYLDSEM